MDFISIDKKQIYTVGYSAFEMNEFISTLKRYNITAVSDVRSLPYSKFKPDYNREYLSKKLKENDIQYVFLGNNLGARFEDKTVYINGTVNFELVSQLDCFKNGVQRLIEGSKKYTIALLCAEKDPIECHRSILIAKNISSIFNVFHILADLSIESHKQLEYRLKKRFGLDQAVLFGDTLKMAYDKQASKIAYAEVNNDAIEG
jgi:uncharacterized protein (DUF488 family)